MTTMHMCGTGKNESELGHGHPHHSFQSPAAEVVDYESLAKDNLQTTMKQPSDIDKKKLVNGFIDVIKDTVDGFTTVIKNTVNGLTAVIKSTFDKCVPFLGEFKKTPAYIVLFFTQPAHILMVLAVALVTTVMWPGDMKKVSNATVESVKPRTLVNFVYLAAFCMHVGAQFWMTFISGMSLYFNLARHAFGDVQKILFPKYFLINSMLSAITLIQFGKVQNAANVWDVYTYLQLFVMSLCFLLELIIWLYVVPPMLRLITIKMAIEKSAGIGNEVGHCDLGPLVNCPHYMAICRAFRQVHMFVSIGNVITMMCTSYHLVYIAA